MLIFIHGPDTFRSQEKLKEIIKQFQQKRDSVGLNVVYLSEENLEFDRLRQETLTQGFLSPKKMIVIKNLLENNNEELFKNVLNFIPPFAKNIEDDNVLVFYEKDYQSRKKTKADKIGNKLFEFLKKQKYIYEFPKLEGTKLNNWIARRIESRGEKIKIPAVKKLASLVGNDLWQLSNEIDKLVAYKENQEITVKDIEQQVNDKSEENIFALTDMIASQNKLKALKLLNNELNNGVNEIYLLTMITRQFRILLQLKERSENGRISQYKIANDLKLHPYVIKKSIPAAKKYSLNQLKDTYSKLLKIDLNLKTSHPNSELLLDLLIIS